MTADIEVKFDVSDIAKTMKQYQNRVKNVQMSTVAEILQTAVDDLIQAEGVGGTQGKWKGFAASTLKSKPKRKGGSLLQDGGDLADMQPKEGDWWAGVVSPAEYAGWHITGTANMPVRDFFALNFDKVLEEIGESIIEEIERG